jgi:SAM-dependent methyltransferase
LFAAQIPGRQQAHRTFRQILKRVPGLQSTVVLASALVDFWRWRDANRVSTRCAEQFSLQANPYGYEDRDELARFDSVVSLLSATGCTFDNALEIGCAEGHFTERLAQVCRCVVAIDVSDTALNRACERCAGLPISFQRADIVRDPLPGVFTLVVAMDVLELIYDPRVLRQLRNDIVDAVAPGGYLLIGNSRQNPVFERALWAKWLVRGGKRISELFADDPRLDHMASASSDLAFNSLFRRTI